MFKNKMLSAVAALAVLSTGAMAFESDANGTIHTITKSGKRIDATYIDGKPADTNLTLSSSQRGDALIFPAFQSDNGWNSEVVIRNTKEQAVVAKVVLYAQSDSRELVDFNIYLSGYDVFRFNINGDKVSTKDSSIAEKASPAYLALPADGNLSKLDRTQDSVTMNKSGNELIINRDQNSEVIPLEEKAGYIIVYGMVQVDGDSNAKDGNFKKYAYHGAANHTKLFLDYRKVLDECRPNWRFPYQDGTITNGMFHYENNVTAPNVDANCSDDLNATASYGVNTIFAEDFGSVDADTLIGTIKLSNGELKGQERELLLTATALENFTEDNKSVIWTEGEYANIQDRDINASGSYDKARIYRDTNDFLISNAYYTYEAEAKDNKMLLTQPHKRVLVQLANFDATDAQNYWKNFESTKYGGFQASPKPYDEEENLPGGKAAEQVSIVSPFNAETAKLSTFNNEVAVIGSSNVEGTVPDFNKGGNGFAIVNFNNRQKALPAIVTQMVGSKVNGVSQTNWIYAPVTKK